MSILATVLSGAYKLIGAKKAFTLPEDEFLKVIEKQNRSRGVFVPTDNKAHYQMIEVNGFPYVAYVLVFVYAVNGARSFAAGFWQLLVILSVMNLIDRFGVDDFWVGNTAAWTIPGTEDLKPYITARDRRKKWIFGTAGMAVISAVLAGVMALII